MIALAFKKLKRCKIDSITVKRTDNTTKWNIKPKIWIVERMFAWLLNFKQLVVNYERTVESAISFTYLSMMCLMVKNIN
jgi:transposase